MSNIRVDLGYTIRDGLELKFRSPVDCSAITGLIVYYPGADGNTTSKVFALADAHGNNVGDIDHLFAENVVVKVILDVTTGMAFVQNADTNAYLEEQLASKAPDGFGLGKKSSEMKIYSTPEELDDLKVAGWYSYYSETTYACGCAGTQYGGILVIPAMYGYTQFFFCRMHYEAYLKRHYDSSTGAWCPWEWVNPPMVVGREYRTTERYNGKPVYTMLVDCGNAPNSGNKAIEYASDKNDVSPIYCRGQITTDRGDYYGEYLDDSYSYNAERGTTFAVNAYANRVVITTGANQSKSTVLAHIKYVKK